MRFGPRPRLHGLTIVSHSICLTKLDVLDTFEEVKIGTAYKLDGKTLDSLPGEATAAVLQQSTPPPSLPLYS